MLPVKAPRDPAPSRVIYRLERLWLRPAIRNSVRIGLPMAMAGWFVATLVLDPGVQGWVTGQAKALRDQVAAHPGLQVTALRLEGMTPEMAQNVRAQLALSLPVSSMDLDLGALQKAVTGLPAVASAQVQLAGGGVLRVRVDERIPVVIWRGPDGLQLVDRDGVALGRIDSRADRPELLVIAGEGANRAVDEALELLRLAEPLEPMMRGIVRVGERRWTISLESGIDILLPETGAAAALSRVMALHRAEDILSRDLVAVDMRDRRRPILRLTPEALLALRRAQGLIGEDDA